MKYQDIKKNNGLISKKKYKCIFHCPITINDCINSIDLKEDKVIIGTLMGDVFLCRVDESKLYPKNNIKKKKPHLSIKKILEEDDDSNINLNRKLDYIKLSINKDVDEISKTNFFNSDKKNNKICLNINNIIKFPKITQIINRSRENIPCVEFESNDIINICIGDLEIIHLENMSQFNKNDKNSTYSFSKLRNYKTENEHIQNCETVTCMLKNSCFLIIFTNYGEFLEKLEFSVVKYENKNLISSEIIKGEIYLSNFVVPFDFDGDLFLFLDYKSKDQRIISVEYTSSLKQRFDYLITEENFGHISHMKLLTKEKILIVRNDKIFEIRYLNENLDIIEKWEHLGDDIINICFIINENNKLRDELINEESNINNNNISINNINIYEDNLDINTIALFKKRIKEIKSSKFSNLINTNNQTANKRINNISRMKKNKKNIIMNDPSFFVKASKIITSLRHKEKKENNILIQTETSIKKRNNNNDNKKKFYSLDYKILIDNDNKYRYEEKKNRNDKKKYSLSSIEIYDKNSKNAINDEKIEDNSYENKTIIQDRNDNKEYVIIALDNNGGIYLYYNDIKILLFNIYDIDNIDTKYKNLKFFDMGFPYYIIANNNYFCITTDHGLFVFSKDK
jgi:hypothetical protein